MSAPTWADHTLPLAKRVALAMLDRGMDDATEAHRAALVADVAAADRLARADCIYADSHEEYWDGGGSESLWVLEEAARKEHESALDAYRARKAQGVDRGE